MADNLLEDAIVPHLGKGIQELVPLADRHRFDFPVRLEYRKYFGPVGLEGQRVGDQGKILEVLDDILAADSLVFGRIREGTLRNARIKFFEQEKVVEQDKIDQKFHL